MCGIVCFVDGVEMCQAMLMQNGLNNGGAIHQSGDKQPCLNDFEDGLRRRGPDGMSQLKVELDSEGPVLHLAASVLQLRGVKRNPGIVRDDKGDVLMFNGEIYDGLTIDRDDNDAAVLFNQLSTEQTDKGIVDLLMRSKGPWSLVYWEHASKVLWFGRDPMGRRSLLMYSHPVFHHWILCSMIPLDEGRDRLPCVEIPPGIYRLNFEGNMRHPQLETVHRWEPRILMRSLVFNDLTTAAEAFINIFRTAMSVRSKVSSHGSVEEHRSRLVLFSGGVDSTLIASALHKVLPNDISIDLCNVSFDGDRAPDRINSIEAFMELQLWASQRKWNLICVDATVQVLQEFKTRVLCLIHPRTSVMDFNIGSAIWMAAKAEGTLYPSGLPYTSASPVVFVGHGADEQCAGYGRHRSRFREGGWMKLQNELNSEMTRLWERNLGRDDRLISDHGREARLPFLDEEVVEFFAQLPLNFLFDADQPRGVGEKMILREGLRMLGLHSLAAKPKRAIQFGSHIGKLTNKECFGSNRAANKKHAGSLDIDSL